MRKIGIGVALMSVFVRTATKRARESSLFEVRASNSTVLALYRLTGFKQVDIRRGCYREPIENALILSRPLETEFTL